MTDLCIYHANCADGFGAAWAVRNFYRSENRPIEFLAAKYGDAPPDVTDRDVFIVDFSYKRDVLLQMAKTAHTITVLDHHKTAVEDLKNLPANVDSVFDMNRSGAIITWDYFFNRDNTASDDPDTPPELLQHIQDRDLWKFELPGTREIQAALFSYEYDFEIWDRLMMQPVSVLRQEGEAIERKHFKDIRELLKSTMRYMRIDGHTVPVANLPYIYSSDAGHMMAKGFGSDGELQPFAACYMQGSDGTYTFSLRSTDQGVDVSAVAKKFGGGGHRNAAGFKASKTLFDSFEIPS